VKKLTVNITMKISLIIILVSIFYITNGQVSYIKSRLLNKSNKQPIQYANIAVLNKRIGTSSNESGEFLISAKKEINRHDSISITAIGFNDTTIAITELTKKIYLEQRKYAISEVTVHPKEKNLLIVNPIDLKKCNSKWCCYGNSFIIARRFPMKSEYEDYEHIRSIKIYTEKHVKKFEFNLHFYEYDSIRNIPIKDLLIENLIIQTPSKIGFGKNLIEVDISEYNLIFPKNGLVVGLEWIVTNANEYEFEEDVVIGKKTIKIKNKKTGPDFILQKEALGLVYNYVGGQWMNIEQFPHSPAIEIVLTD